MCPPGSLAPEPPLFLRAHQRTVQSGGGFSIFNNNKRRNLLNKLLKHIRSEGVYEALSKINNLEYLNLEILIHSP